MKPVIMVTGGAGYIGSHTCKALAAKGFVPVVVDNLTTGHRWAVRWGPLHLFDLQNAAALADVFKQYRFEAVLHFAAVSNVGESMRKPLLYFENNVCGSLALLRAMEDAGVSRIVLSSTCATYGIPDTPTLTEESPQRPITPYGESKLSIERVLSWLGDLRGLSWLSLRYFNAAGADPDEELGEAHDPETHLVPLTIQAALGQRQSLEIYGTDYPTPDGTAIRDYIHVTDLAHAHAKAVEHLLQDRKSGALNLGTGRGHSVREVISMVESTIGRPVPVREVSRRPGDPARLVANAERACTILDWRPQLSSIRSIVETAARWHAGSEQGLCPAAER